MPIEIIATDPFGAETILHRIDELASPDADLPPALALLNDRQAPEGGAIYAKTEDCTRTWMPCWDAPTEATELLRLEDDARLLAAELEPIPGLALPAWVVRDEQGSLITTAESDHALEAWMRGAGVEEL